MREGRKVTRCAASVIKDLNEYCLEDFRRHWKCLENWNHSLYNCRPEEMALGRCVFEKLVRFLSFSFWDCLLRACLPTYMYGGRIWETLGLAWAFCARNFWDWRRIWSGEGFPTRVQGGNRIGVGSYVWDGGYAWSRGLKKRLGSEIHVVAISSRRTADRMLTSVLRLGTGEGDTGHAV